jgi:hypothetical protein
MLYRFYFTNGLKYYEWPGQRAIHNIKQLIILLRLRRPCRYRRQKIWN